MRAYDPLMDEAYESALMAYEADRATASAERNLCPACLSFADCICTCHLCGTYLDPDEGRSMCRACGEAERGWAQAEWEKER